MDVPPCEGSPPAATALHACMQEWAMVMGCHTYNLFQQEQNTVLDALQIPHKMGKAYLTASVTTLGEGVPLRVQSPCNVTQPCRRP